MRPRSVGVIQGRSGTSPYGWTAASAISLGGTGRCGYFSSLVIAWLLEESYPKSALSVGTSPGPRTITTTGAGAVPHSGAKTLKRWWVLIPEF